MNRSTSIYQDMAARTGGSIYIGVVGPVRTGKSTFIKRFMETQVLPHIDNAYRRDRAQDELPQSGSGRTIMTAEPKFVPEEAVRIRLEDDVTFSVRLIDCVGYMVPGAMGQFEDLSPRMVMTPWYDHEIPMTEAAEIGTRKVIADHSTVGIVITTDGTITDIPREDYLEAEERVIRELQEIGKPFLVLLNSADPHGSRAASIAGEISEKFGVSCLPVNCLTLEEQELQSLLRGLLYEFPLQELDVFLPPWVDALPGEHPIKANCTSASRPAQQTFAAFGSWRRIWHPYRTRKTWNPPAWPPWIWGRASPRPISACPAACFTPPCPSAPACPSPTTAT